VPDNNAVIAGTFDYGLTGCAALAQENLFATQFHPEKSHTAGLTLLKNFLDWDGRCS
jgi:glutamine amidotransferase